MTLDTLLDMLKAVTAERDGFIAEANNRLAFLNGKIETLQEMIDSLTPKVTAPEEEAQIAEQE